MITSLLIILLSAIVLGILNSGIEDDDLSAHQQRVVPDVLDVFEPTTQGPLFYDERTGTFKLRVNRDVEWVTSYERPELDRAAVERLNIFFAVVLGFSCVNLLFSSLLLVGVLQRKTNFLMAWIVFAWICTIIHISPSIISQNSMLKIWVCVALVCIVLQIYFIAVVRTYYDSLRNPPSDVVPIVETENGPIFETTNTPQSYPAYTHDGPSSPPPPYTTCVQNADIRSFVLVR